jgi:hypothetical protein
MQSYPGGNGTMYYPQYPNVQPYSERLYQPQNNFQQPMLYNQAPIQVPTQPQTNQFLPGQMVDSIESVKAKDVNMSGSPVFYPKTDGSEIYRKQLQADGRSQIFVYRLVNTEDQTYSEQKQQVDIVGLFNQLRTDVCTEISEIKKLLPLQAESPQQQQKGGNQK